MKTVLHGRCSRRACVGITCAFILGSLAGSDAWDAKAQPKQSPTPITFSLGTSPSGYLAYIFAAKEKGYFLDEGLDVSFIVPSSLAEMSKVIALGAAQFGTGNSADVLTARSQGLGVVSLAATVRYETLGVMAAKSSNITTLKHLEGRTVGLTGIPGNRVLFSDLLRRNDVDETKLQIVVVGVNTPHALASGRIDAIGDAPSWRVPLLYNVALGKPPEDTSTHTFLPFADLGAPRSYILNIVGSEDFVRKNRSATEGFMRAYVKGLEWAATNPEAAIDIFEKFYPGTDKSVNLAQWKATAALIRDDETRRHGLGWQDPEVWRKQEEFLRTNKLLPISVDISKTMANDYLPGKN